MNLRRRARILFLYPEKLYIGLWYLITGRVLNKHKHLSNYMVIEMRTKPLKGVSYEKIFYHPGVELTSDIRMAARDKFKIPENFLKK